MIVVHCCVAGLLDWSIAFDLSAAASVTAITLLVIALLLEAFWKLEPGRRGR
jgi:hypothetical protein